jgi:DNA repair exonuclease SbcCD ATPase subunit
MTDDDDRTASLMTPAKLAQLKVRPRPSASPAAWLDQLAADAGSGHIRRLLDLRGQLEAQVANSQYEGAAAACKQLAAAVGELDLSQLQPRGWLARATGRGKEAAAGFRAQAGLCARAGDALAREVRALQQRLQAQAPVVERTLAECETEIRAIQKIMDQGARWLQDMRNQLKTREGAGGDPATLQTLQEDTRRCELLVARLKQLRSADAAAVQAVEHCRAAAPRRAALSASLQQLLDTHWKEASRQLDALADEAGTASVAGAQEPARRAFAALAEALRKAAGEAAALQSQEQALAAELVALQQPLQAAA